MKKTKKQTLCPVCSNPLRQTKGVSNCEGYAKWKNIVTYVHDKCRHCQYMYTRDIDTPFTSEIMLCVSLLYRAMPDERDAVKCRKVFMKRAFKRLQCLLECRMLVKKKEFFDLWTRFHYPNSNKKALLKKIKTYLNKHDVLYPRNIKSLTKLEKKYGS